jgi:hypothetical protein
VGLPTINKLARFLDATRDRHRALDTYDAGVQAITDLERIVVRTTPY